MADCCYTALNCDFVTLVLVVGMLISSLSWSQFEVVAVELRVINSL